MATHRDLIAHLPQYMREFVEMNKIMTAEQTEMNSLFDAVESVWNDQYIQTADEATVKRWEDMFGIIAKSTDTLSERRFRILAKLNRELPYTMVRLNELLTTLCGSGGYEVILTASSYHIEVKIALGNKNNYDGVEELLHEIIPANLTKHIQIMYNTHEMLSEYTHGELETYTHEELREEVMEE